MQNCIEKLIDEKFTQYEKQISNLAHDQELAKSVEIKIGSFESKIETLKKALKEKDSQISALELRLEVIEKKSKEEKKATEKKVKEFENNMKIFAETKLNFEGG